MPRSPRVIVEGKVYELVPRAREGLPLPPTETTNTLLKGILARTQRDQKVELCNLVAMNNHSHMHVIPGEAEMLPRFYGEFQKKITDTLRSLLGERSLRLWEDRTGSILLEDLEDVIERLVYIFCNPTKAGLVNSIDEYPGLSSWHAFTSCEPSVDAEVEIEAPWYPVESIPLLPRSRVLNHRDDKRLVQQLKSAEAAVPYKLVLKPLAWLRLYDITSPEEIEEVRQEVIRRVRAREAEYMEDRRKARRSVAGAERLKREPYMKPHNPKARSRKIFLICSNKERRFELLKFFSEIFDRLKECYLSVKHGILVDWPPGTFTPWLPPQACCSV